MELIETTSLSTDQKAAILDLWNGEYPVQVGYKSLADFEHYLQGLTDGQHFLLQNDKGTVQGWACKFIREGNQWFVIILHKAVQGQGRGSLLLERLKEGEEALYGWVVDHERYIKQNGEPYRSPLPFYLKNGFAVCTDSRLELDILSAVKIKWVRTLAAIH